MVLQLGGTTDRNSAVPLYQQIEKIILDAIKEGSLLQGVMLPNERLLQQIYGVSRQTIRQALDSLEEGGYIERIQGVGTRVANVAPRSQNRSVTSMSADLAARGLKPESKTLGISLVTPSEDVARAMGMRPNEKTWLVRRLRLGDGQPVALNDLLIPPDLEFSARELGEMQSYYQLLKEKYNLVPTEATDRLRAREATAEEAELLNVSEGHTLVILERWACAADQRPIEYTYIYFLPDHFEYSIYLTAG